VDDPPECWVRAHEDAVAKLHHGIEQEACRCHIDTLTSKTLSTLLKWRAGTELWGARGKLAPAPAPSSRPAGMSPISRKRLPATEQNSKTLRTYENSDGGALCTVCAYVRPARSMPIQMGRPLSAFPAHTRNHLAHGAKGPKWGSSGGGGICACVGYRGVLGCSDHDPASRSSSRRADHSANCRSIRPWFMTQPACTSSTA
jgi:hypothetical protein